MPNKPVGAVLRDRPTAMVKPPPVGAGRHDHLSLEDILKKLGNNRAYTVIKVLDDSWLIHFEGDHKPTLIKS
jgi:hypothetical protein